MANNIYGFAGVMLIVSPDFETINIFMIFPILCAAGYSGSMIIIKYTSNEDNVYTNTSCIHRHYNFMSHNYLFWFLFRYG